MNQSSIQPAHVQMRWFFALVVTLFTASVVLAESTADHSKFEQLNVEFETIEDVNNACIDCHNQADQQLHKTIHWKWNYTTESGEQLGKLNVTNGYHGSVASNLETCGSCHVGYGLTSKVKDVIKESAVDCLMCHDNSGEYFFSKFHQDGAECSTCHDDNADSVKKRVKAEGKLYTQSLEEIAQQAGATTIASCGSCHFNDGGADGAKHGDLDSSLITASKELDVHMSSEGAGLTCNSCHQANDHQLSGSRYEAGSPTDHAGINALEGARATCVSCHGDRPMQDEKLNDHADVIACQTCHIPSYARGGIATKTLWDWSTAGELNRSRRPKVEYYDDGRVSYSSQKGSMEYGENLAPSFQWFNGDAQYPTLGKLLDPDGVTNLVELGGSASDGNSKIFPMHQFRSIVPYDTQTNQMLPVNLTGRSKDPLWNGFNWDKALKAGAKATGVEFSGDYDFAETLTSRPLNHMVAPKEQALSCNDCHGDAGLLDDVEGLYIPGRLQYLWLDKLALIALILTLVGVTGHGVARAIFTRRRNRNDR